MLVYSGSIGTFYGFTEIARFFKIFREKEPRAFLLALVNNSPQVAAETIERSGIEKGGYRVLNLHYAQVPEWLKQADISVMFYRRENYFAGCCPTKFAESLACAVPVILNKGIGDCDDIVKKRRIGFVLENFEDSSFRKTRDDFLSSLKWRDDMRVRCRNAAEELFSLDMGIIIAVQISKN